ncbi:MAG: patatin-like phospholipase family protein [Clostridia bacterium]|nr:patatin-like phospholipase family protein [Clostridia bacterium]
MSKKLGFALGTGGARGTAHVGFLQAMEENGVKPDYVTGCSMGSIVGAAYCAGVPLHTIQAAIRGLRLFHLILPTAKKGGLFETRKVRHILQHYIGDLDFKDLQIPFRCVAVDMKTQRLIEFSEGSVLDAIIASSSIPSIFCPLEKDGMRLVDGGVLERVPVEQVKNMGADVVIAVDVLGSLNCKEEMPGTIGILLETLDIMDNYRTQRRRKENQDIIDLWLEPDLGGMSQYTFKNFDFAMGKGYEIGIEHVETILKLIE